MTVGCKHSTCAHAHRNTMSHAHKPTHTCASTLRHWAGTSLKDWKQLKLSSAVALGRPVAARGELPLCISLSVSATHSDMRGRVAALFQTHCHSSSGNIRACMLTRGFVKLPQRPDRAADLPPAPYSCCPLLKPSYITQSSWISERDTSTFSGWTELFCNTLTFWGFSADTL